jgi:nicotinamide riboside kinase
MIKKIVILGPESTGKSTLCEELATHYKTRWVPEYARTYLLEHGTAYQFDELLKKQRATPKKQYRYLSIPICM